jgi:hypothetical protein
MSRRLSPTDSINTRQLSGVSRVYPYDSEPTFRNPPAEAPEDDPSQGPQGCQRELDGLPLAAELLVELVLGLKMVCLYNLRPVFIT